MINPKNICISSCVGFFLSFFIGLVSPEVHFPHFFLRALIVALVFAILCVGITFVYQKFLSDENVSDSVGSDPLIAKNPGSVVNIVVDDTNLPDDGMSPKFTVMNSHSPLGNEMGSVPSSEETSSEKKSEGLSASDAEALSKESVPSEPKEAEPSSENSFQPVSLGSTSGDATKQKNTQGNDSVQLDELPDLGGLESVGGGSSASDLSSSDGLVRDSDFATGGSKMTEQPVNGETNVMARAIQTLLAQDNN